MGRTLEDLDAVPRAGKPATAGSEDVTLLKRRLENALDRAKVLEEERNEAGRHATSQDERIRTALQHSASLTVLAAKLCRRILADGGDLGGLEGDLQRLGVEWNQEL